MQTQREKIIKKIYEILENKPNGIRYTDLVNEIKSQLPEVNENTIHGTIWIFRKKVKKKKIKDVIVPQRGWYILKKYYYKDLDKISKAFADYLVNDLRECTKAIPLGSNRFQDRWGTPNVIGTYKILKFGNILIEIISAKINSDSNQLITSFGEACAYKLFSHKVYLVIPKKDTNKADIERLESLCLKFGIGLILFDRHNEENPEFEILTRAVKSEPDYFYLNKYLKFIENEAKELF